MLHVSKRLTLLEGVQLTGNTSLAYYAPQIFASMGAGQSTLLVTSFFGVVEVVAVVAFFVSHPSLLGDYLKLIVLVAVRSR
jgi:hypothetical protein